tara:strand:+ start:1260 stop:2081 length:822 start_codon:yes stop_codon:yes gene_type:complete
MAFANVFPEKARTIVSSSDRIAAKRDRTIYRELANNVADHGSIAVKKKCGNVNYLDNFYATTCSGTGAHPRLAASKNYDLFLSVSKGKRYDNPLLDGGSARSIPSAQNGNHLRVTYENSNKIAVRSLAKGECPDAGEAGAPKLDTPWVIGSSGPEPDDAKCWPNESCNGLSTVPSYIIDPSYSIFYNTCDNKSPWKGAHVADVSFQEMPSYWRSANAQPLAGMKYPSAVTFANQYPMPFTASTFPYPPRPRPPSPTDGAKELFDAWCKNQGGT